MKTTGKLIIFVFTFMVLIANAHAADDDPLIRAIGGRADKATVEALLAQGANVNAQNKDGETPLTMAASFGYKDIVELLLAKGALVDGTKSFGGKTALNAAAFSGYKDIVELLLAKGADVNFGKDLTMTPLHWAAAGGRKEVVELLLAKGADINAKDMNGDWATPLVTAMAYFDGDGANYDKHRAVVVLLEDFILKQAKNPGELFVQLSRQLANNNSSRPRSLVLEVGNDYTPGPGLRLPTQQTRRSYTVRDEDISTRRRLIKLAGKLKPPQAIPEEARKHFVEGSAIKAAAKNPAQQALAAQSFIEALKVAPWWGDAYYNLGVTQELAEKYDEAEKAFNFYLLGNVSEAEKREVQDRIYALSAKRKLAGAK